MRFERCLRHSLGAGLMALVLTGCMQLPAKTAAPIVASPPSGRSDPVVDLLAYARRLADASPEQRAEAVEHKRAMAVKTPSALNYARLALAFGAPQQKRYTPDEAARYAQRALDAEDAHWSPAAHQYLSDYARLYQALTDHESSAGSAGENDTPTPEPAADANDKRRIADLQARLDEAHRKLREMADIEDNLSTENP